MRKTLCSVTFFCTYLWLGSRYQLIYHVGYQNSGKSLKISLETLSRKWLYYIYNKHVFAYWEIPKKYEYLFTSSTGEKLYYANTVFRNMRNTLFVPFSSGSLNLPAPVNVRSDNNYYYSLLSNWIVQKCPTISSFSRKISFIKCALNNVYI